MKLIKEQNDELANIKKQYNELTAEKEKRDKMLEDVSKTLSNEKTFAEVERKNFRMTSPRQRRSSKKPGINSRLPPLPLRRKRAPRRRQPN